MKRIEILLTLFALAAFSFAVLIGLRAGLFSFDAKPLTDSEVKALWTFAGASLAGSVSLAGTAISQIQSHRTERRLALDSAVSSLKLLSAGDGTSYAPPAVVSGAMATLIHLEQPLIAIRTMLSAWKSDAVDPDTACWVISEALKSPDEDAQREAAQILSEYAGSLTRKDEGFYSWPIVLADGWPTHIGSQEVHLALMNATFQLVKSKPGSWWLSPGLLGTGPLIMGLWTLYRSGPPEDVKHTAASFIRAMIPKSFADDSEITSRSSIEIGEMRRKLSSVPPSRLSALEEQAHALASQFNGSIA